MPQVSIIIPTLKEEKYLPKLLESLKHQTFKDFEVIVADNRSPDRTREIAKNYGAIIAEGGSPAIARNQGAGIAQGETFYFLDADTHVDPDFLEKSFNHFEKKNCAIATCRALPDSRNIFDRLIFFAQFVSIYLLQKIWPTTVGFCIIVKKDVFQKVDGFNEKLQLSEDVIFGRAAAKHGGFCFFINPPIHVSMRRFKKEGRLKMTMILVKSGIHDLLGIKHEVGKTKYQFGHYDDERETDDSVNVN